MTEVSRELLERGVAAAERGRTAEGLALIREACKADPKDPEARTQLARWLSMINRQPEAIAAATHALALRPTRAATLDTIGVVFSRANQHERAVACFRAAVAGEPGRASFHFKIASSLTYLGQFDVAEQALEVCLTLEPRYWPAHPLLASLRRQTPDHNHVERLEGLLAASDLDPDAELHLRHALAKELEDLGRYDESFAHLVAGNARKRAAVSYDFDLDRRLFETVMRLFPEPMLPPDATVGDGDEPAPIFVVGMPRTGTTLVERILSSHTQVASAGESLNFGLLLKWATGTPPPRMLDEVTLERSLAVDLRALGRAYVERTKPATNKPRFVDKLPLNFFYLGHIARALPAARMVVVRRNPADTGLSNFRQLFAADFPYYQFALDLRDIARYYVMFDRLIAHWCRVLPGRVHEVRYETLVEDQRGETEQLLEHCRLDWEDACLQFDRNEAAVATASATQVRQPLYGTSVGRWRRYERHLEPLMGELRAAGVELP